MNLSKFIFISLFFGCGFSMAQSLNCSEPQWVGEAGVGQDGHFQGQLESTCTTPKKAANLEQAFSFMIKQLSNLQIHAGPTSETYLNLPGFAYDLTEKEENLAIRSNVHVASDLLYRLEYGSFSSSITSEVEYSYLRKVDTILSVSLAESADQWSMKMNSLIRVEKPWFAPVDFFEQKSKQMSLDRFRQKRDQAMQSLSEHL